MSRYNQNDGEIVVCIIPPPQDNEINLTIDKIPKSSSSTSICSNSQDHGRRSSLYYKTMRETASSGYNFVRRRSTFSNDRNKIQPTSFRSNINLGCSDGNLQRKMIGGDIGTYQEFRRYSSHDKVMT